MPIEVVNLMAQLGLGGLFFWLYLITNKRLQDQQDKHDRDIGLLYNMWLNDIRNIAKLPTDLEGNYRMGPDSSVKA